MRDWIYRYLQFFNSDGLYGPRKDGSKHELLMIPVDLNISELLNQPSWNMATNMPKKSSSFGHCVRSDFSHSAKLGVPEMALENDDQRSSGDHIVRI